MTFTDRDVTDSAVRNSLFLFAWFAYNILEPGHEFISAWHVQAMAYQIEKSINGGCLRSLITVPPRHFKSFLVSIALPAYLLGHNPSARIMVASYGAELATSFGRKFRTLMRSKEYRRLFPRTVLDNTRCTDHDVCTRAGGCRLSVSPTAAVTGFGADILIIDDLMKAGDANSPSKLQETKDSYDQVLFSRLNNKTTGVVIAIQQRLHEDDLASYLLDKGFHHLNLKAIAEEDETFALPNGGEHRRMKGDALFPEHEPLETLEKIKREIGPVAFSAQYMQNPVAPGGNMLRWEWFGTYDEVPQRDEFQYVVQSYDTAHSPEPGADYSVCITLGFQHGKWLLLDVWRKQVAYPDLRNKAKQLFRLWRPEKVILEIAASGWSLYSDLCRDLNVGRERIERYRPRIGKEERFAEQTAQIQDGLVSLPREAPWLPAFKRELQAFPAGTHDDQVDALAQFLDWCKRTHSPVGGYAPRELVRGNIERRNIVRR